MKLSAVSGPAAEGTDPEHNTAFAASFCLVSENRILSTEIIKMPAS